MIAFPTIFLEIPSLKLQVYTIETTNFKQAVYINCNQV